MAENSNKPAFKAVCNPKNHEIEQSNALSTSDSKEIKGNMGQHGSHSTSKW